MKIKKSIFYLTIGVIFLILPEACIEPVDAEFDLQEDIIFIDAYALTEPGVSTVSISKSTFDNLNNFKIVNVPNARVKIENIDTGETIDYLEDSSGIYQCPPDFAVSLGEQWKLNIDLEDGKKVESKIQTVTTSVPIDNVHIEYSDEIQFDTDQGKFVPGHRVSIDLQDPEGEENYYLWKYRTFERQFICVTCERGIFRNGECIPTGLSWGPPYYNYTCIPDCWTINFGKELPIFDDRLEDGSMITDREVTILPYYRQSDILIEIQQLSLDKSAYDYFKIIDSQVNQSAGLNAPPPAALLGNLFNPEDSSELILGQFTVAGITTKRVFIDRSQLDISPIESSPLLIFESCPTCPVSAPCVESATRTAIKPEGWL